MKTAYQNWDKYIVPCYTVYSIDISAFFSYDGVVCLGIFIVSLTHTNFSNGAFMSNSI